MGFLVSRTRASSQGSDLYDLSPYYDLMDEVLPTWSEGIGWPAAPDTSNGLVQVNTAGGLSAQLALSNRIVEFTESITLSGNIEISGSNLILRAASNTLNISGGIIQRNSAMGPNVVWFEGGNYFPNAAMVFRRPRDLLFDDVYIEGELSMERQSGQSTAPQRLAFLNSTVDGRDFNLGAMLFAQGATDEDRCEDIIIANCKLLGLSLGQYAARIQSANKIIQVECANQMEAGSGERAVRYTNCQYIVTAGRPAKYFYGGGNWFLNYLGNSNEWPYACSDSRWKDIKNYHTTPQMAVNNALNDGTVENIECFSSGTGVGSQPTSISPLTIVGGVSNVQAWDGSTYPDVSSYGAQR